MHPRFLPPHAHLTTSQRMFESFPSLQTLSNIRNALLSIRALARKWMVAGFLANSGFSSTRVSQRNGGDPAPTEPRCNT
eukprot:2514841-Amphidinium_carterae.1